MLTYTSFLLLSKGSKQSLLAMSTRLVKHLMCLAFCMLQVPVLVIVR